MSRVHELLIDNVIEHDQVDPSPGRLPHRCDVIDAQRHQPASGAKR